MLLLRERERGGSVPEVRAAAAEQKRQTVTGISYVAAGLRQAVPCLPQPCSGIVEGLLAAATAGLAAWNAHLHKHVNVLRNGKPKRSG